MQENTGNAQESFEKLIDQLFLLYAPGATYNVVDEYGHNTSSVAQVLEPSIDHVSFFSSQDTENKFWALVKVLTSDTIVTHCGYKFRKLVDKTLYVFEYNKELAYSFAVMYALLKWQSAYAELSQRDFVNAYLEQGE